MSAHARLVEAIRADTVSAARAAQGVARVVLVVDGPGVAVPAGTEVVVQRRPGLNEALADAALEAGWRWPADGVAALLGDLPALRPVELADALGLASGVDRAYVPDAEGTGTTLLTAGPQRHLAPRFGAGSAARHATDAAAVDAGPGLRRDVDTVADLRAAARLGLGPETSREFTAARGDSAFISDRHSEGMNGAHRE